MTVRRLLVPLLLVLANLVAATQATLAVESNALLFVSDANYPPITYLEGETPKGVGVDVVRALAERLGRPIKIRLMPWEEAQAMVLRGDADALFPMSVTEVRKQVFDFSEPMLELQFSIFTRVTRTDITSVADLPDRRVAVTGGGLPRQLLRNDPRIRLTIIDDYPQGFQMLKDGRVDAVVGDRWVGAYELAERGIKGVWISGRPVARLAAAAGVKKGNLALLAAIDNGLRSLQADGTIDRITAKWEPKEVVFMTRAQIKRWGISGAFVLLLLIVLVVAVWLRALRREVDVRRQAENQIITLNQRLSLATRAAGIGIWDWDVPGNVLVWDDEMYRIFQARKEDHAEVYLTWARALHPADRDRAEAEVQAALEHGQQFHTEFRIIRPDGSVRTIKAAAETFLDAAGKPRRMVGLNYDITEIKQAEATLRASEEKLRALYEAEPDCLKLLEPDATLREINLAGLRILEADNPAAVIGTNLLPMVAPEHLEAVRALLAAVARGEKRRLEFQFVGLKGTVRWLEMTAVPIRDQATDRAMILGVSRDVTARKHDEAALLALNARYARQEAALTTLTRSYATLPNNLATVFKEITEVVAKTLEVDRASIWRYSPGASAIVCEELFDAKTGCHSSGRRVLAATYPVYFRALAGAEIIAARDARQDPRTKELAVPYFLSQGVTSLLETPIHSQGAMAGVVSCEHAGPLRDWTADEQTFAVAVANLVSALLAQLERQSLEEQLRQSQKMDAFGRLAGGVAHDFNNLLTVITGHCELLLLRTAPDGSTHDSLEEIRKAAERAAALTSQLLAFSRQQLLAPRVVDLNLIVTDIQKMLRRLIGEDVTLVANLSPNLCPVRVDPGQMDQVLMNLTVNARDAMPNGGRIIFTTRNIDLDGTEADPRPDTRPGRYVMLSVSDTGSGMPPEIQAQIFEPFFTTKGVGKGTGLGLAVVHGIIQQSGGHIVVQSEVGAGTTFTIYLPVVLERLSETIAGPVRKASRGGETILLVEDENAVRQFATLALQQLGYTVLTAASGPEALNLLASVAMQVDLLVTDLVMPEMGGRELAETCAARYPTLRVLYLSGYMDDEVVRRGILQADVAFLQKPFTIDSLAKKVPRSPGSILIDPINQYRVTS